MNNVIRLHAQSRPQAAPACRRPLPPPEPMHYLIEIGPDQWNMTRQRPMDGRWLYRGTLAGCLMRIDSYLLAEADTENSCVLEA